MTAPATDRFARPVRATGPWSVWWRGWYRVLRLGGAFMTRLALRTGYGNVVVLRVQSRHSGRERAVPLGLLETGDHRYLGHPSGDTGWTLDVRVAGVVIIESANIPATRVRAEVLGAGPERDAAVRATFRQHPFPGNALYRLGARHVFATGVFFRLEPM